MPVIVCAAGNKSAEEISYPAAERGFVVAFALDRYGRDAGYNCRIPADAAAFAVGAYSGTNADPLGIAIDTSGTPVDLYGSSYAAALVAGSLVAGR